MTPESASKGSAIFLAVFAITAFLNYAFNVAMGWFFTPEQYGILGVAEAFMALLGLFIASGFPWTVTKFISEKEVNQEKQNAIFKTALILNIALGILVSLILLASYELSIINLGGW